MVVLDVAVGTGAVARESRGLLTRPGRVVGIDPSMGMLIYARRAGIPVIQGIAEHLPFRDETFDFLSMGYALRHVSYLDSVFREDHRVLRPGGRLLILEFRRPSARVARHLAQFYFGLLASYVAQFGGGNRNARTLMRYCWASVSQCVPSDTVHAALDRCGFIETRSKVDFGVLIEYMAVKPRREGVEGERVPPNAVGADDEVPLAPGTVEDLARQSSPEPLGLAAGL